MKRRMGERDGTGANRTAITSLSVKARSWATPDASVANDGESTETFDARRERVKESKKNGNGMGEPLAVQAVRSVSLWRTPDTGESLTGHGRRGGKAGNGSQSGQSLEKQAEATWGQAPTGRPWPSPQARDVKGEQTREAGKERRLNREGLPTSAASFPSPPPGPTSTTGGGPCSSPTPSCPPPSALLITYFGTLSRLSEAEARRCLRGPAAGRERSLHARRLNASFAEWLMNWPVGHTGSGASATEYTLYLGRTRSALCGVFCEYTDREG